MKMKHIFLLILLFSSFISCNKQQKEDLKTVKFTHYKLWRSNLNKIDLKDSSTFKLEIKSSNNNKEYILRSTKEGTRTNHSYLIKSGSIFFNNLNCPIFDTISIQYRGNESTLFISNYNEPQTYDEESYLFWNKDYGLLAIYNYTMGPILLYEPNGLEGISELLYDRIVELEKQNKN